MIFRYYNQLTQFSEQVWLLWERLWYLSWATRGGQWRKHHQSSDKSTIHFSCEINGNTKEIIEYVHIWLQNEGEIDVETLIATNCDF